MIKGPQVPGKCLLEGKTKKSGCQHHRSKLSMPCKKENGSSLCVPQCPPRSLAPRRRAPRVPWQLPKWTGDLLPYSAQSTGPDAAAGGGSHQMTPPDNDCDVTTTAQHSCWDKVCDSTPKTEESREGSGDVAGRKGREHLEERNAFFRHIRDSDIYKYHPSC